MSTPVLIQNFIKIFDEIRELLASDKIHREKCKRVLINLHKAISMFIPKIIGTKHRKKESKEVTINLSRRLVLISETVKRIHEISEKTLIDILLEMLIFETEIYSYWEGYQKCCRERILYRFLSLLNHYKKYNLNWAVSVVLLTIMDLETIAFLKQKNLAPGGAFKDRVKLVLTKCKNKRRLSKLSELVISDDLWDLRHRIIHKSYVPSDEEVHFIINQVEAYLDWLKKC